jgi:predicted DNA-binding transcriptional regulator AlpA
MSRAKTENSHAKSEQPAAQVAFSKKAAALKAAAKVPQLPENLIAANAQARAEAALSAITAHNRHDRQNVHGARAPPVRLLDKNEILTITNVSFPTVWLWMRQGSFPRSRIVGGKSMWLSTEVEAWLGALPVRKLKGDGEAA